MVVSIQSMSSIAVLRWFCSQISLLVLVGFVVSTTSHQIESDVLVSPFSNLVGARLVGIFDDNPNENLTTTTVRPTKEKPKIFIPPEVDRIKFMNQIHPNETYECDEVIFEEDNKIRLIPSDGPTCWLDSPRLTTANDRSFKRNVVTDHSLNINYFTIPKDGSETISTNSYIDIQIRICSEPRGQVLVTDTVTKQTITAFVNKGTAYQCNHWQENEMQHFISSSNNIQVEYWSPIDGNYEVNFHYLTEKNREGKRHIKYKTEDDLFTAFEMTIIYKEVPFQYKEIEAYNYVSGVKALTKVNYEPNMVQTFVFNKRLVPNSNDIYFGIVAEINKLDLDFDKGDYLLVGSGSKPTFRKNSKLQIISEKIEQIKDKRNIWIDADSAFVRIVTHNSLKPKTNALEFVWIPSNNKTSDTKKDEYNSRLMEASIRLCFQNFGLMAWRTQVEQPFKSEFVHIANNYLINEDKSITTLINVQSVILMVDEDLNSHTNKTTTVNLAIASPYDPEYPLVPKETVYDIFFGSSQKRVVLRTVTVTDCSEKPITYIRILIPILVIMFVSTVILVIFWRFENNNVKQTQMFNKKNKETLKRLQPERTDGSMLY